MHCVSRCHLPAQTLSYRTLFVIPLPLIPHSPLPTFPAKTPHKHPSVAKMADVQKPVETAEAPVAPAVEPTAAPVVAPVETLAADKPVETVEPATEEPAKTEGETAAPAEEKKEEKPVEPIYSGALGYKAPGLKK